MFFVFTCHPLFGRVGRRRANSTINTHTLNPPAMADDDHADIVEEETKSNKQGAEAAKALDLVTDNVPEKQLDENKVKQAMAALAAAQKADKEAQRQRDKELAAVKVSAADIEVVATEAEVDKKLAERRLREHNGSLIDALKSFL